MSAKGKLIIIGGAVDLGYSSSRMRYRHLRLPRLSILKECLPKQKQSKIEVIIAGSINHENVEKLYRKAFNRIGQEPNFISIKDRLQADIPEYLTRIKNTSVVFFTGGDQQLIIDLIKNTQLMNSICERYATDESFILVGTSAGAMIMSSFMITEGGLEEALINNDLKITHGLNVLSNCIVDTHFIKRGRFSRLAHTVIIYPDKLGIGLGENTALIIKDGDIALCKGSGMIVIIDGRFITKSNIESVIGDEPIYAENLIVHLLIKDTRFSLEQRVFV